MTKPFLTKWTFLLKLRLFFIVLGLIIISIFLHLKVVPGGQITYSRDYDSWFKSSKGFIYGLTPAERVSLENGSLPKVIGDPVYFSLFTPRPFDRAKLTIEYRDHLSKETPLIETGVLIDKLVWRYDLKPLENKILDQLKFKWHRLEDGERLVLQASENYSNLADFENDLAKGKLKDCPAGPQACLAVYNYQLDLDYHLPNYQTTPPLIIDQPLRGTHQFYIYLNNEPLHLEFEFVDLNQDKEQDPITVILYSGAKVIAAPALADNNLNSENGRLEIKSLTLNEKSLPTGVYKVEVKVTDDVVIKKIVSSVGKLSFINKLWPVSKDKPLTFYTDANYLQVKILNPASLQVIKFGSENFPVTETYNQFTFKTGSSAVAKEINLSKDDVILENSGVFAVTPTSLFNPSLKKVDRYFKPLDAASYLIATYQTPLGSFGTGEIKTATAELNLRGAFRAAGKYSFMISIPGLSPEDGTADYLEIKRIKIELSGRTLWQKIFP